MSTRAGPSAYALLADGTPIEIRAARPEDFAAVRELHAKMSPDNPYLRFFSMSPAAAEQEARRICREPGSDHAALLAVLDGEVVGCGAYDLGGDGSGPAEVAMTVADEMHNRGIGTLLLEHLISLARGQGIRAFAAETLTENTLMLQVFANAGLRAHRTLEDGVYDLRFPLPAGGARELVASFLASNPQGGWLPRELTTLLLGCYGIPLADSIAVTTADAAAAAAARTGVPVALKANVPDLVVRRKGAGAVLLDLHGADEVRRGFRSLEDAFGDRLTSVIVQPMITGSVELMINVLEEQVFGPVVLFGLDGAAGVLADRSARLAPLTDTEAEDLIRSIRAAPLLLGRPGTPGADLASLKDMLLRVSQMADDLPQITELELSPVIARRDGALAADARIFLQPAKSTDAYLRQLR